MEDTAGYRRLIYTSVEVGDDIAKIFKASRANNGLDGVTGVLVHHEGRFVQVLEGWESSVAETFDRIKADPRHRSIVVVADSIEEKRVFGEWAMAGIPGESELVIRDRLRAMLRNAPVEVCRAFEGII